MSIQPLPIESIHPGVTPANDPDGVSYDIPLPQLGSACAALELHNNSPYAFRVYGTPGSVYLGLLAIQGQDTFPVRQRFQGLKVTPIANLPPQAAPLSVIYGDIYPESIMQQAQVGQIQYQQQTNIANTVGTQGTSNAMKNDNNPPGTEIIEATPSDQTTSSVQDFNDASGSRHILSAGVLRTIWSFLRGDASANKAQISFGDPGDPSIITYYGTLEGNATSAGSVPVSGITGNGALPTGITVPAAQVTGTVANATNATNATNANNASTAATANNANLLGNALWVGEDTNDAVLHLQNTTNGQPKQLGFVAWDGTTNHYRTVVDGSGIIRADTSTTANSANSANTAALENVYDSTTSGTAPAALSIRQARRWAGATDPTKVAGAPAPAEADLWFQDGAPGGTQNTQFADATVPNGGYNSYSSINQAWQTWVASENCTLIQMAFYAAGDGGTNANFWQCVWDTSGNLLGYAGPGAVSGGSATIGGQKWNGLWTVVSPSAGISLTSGVAYRIGFQWPSGQLVDWSEFANNTSPFTNHGHGSQTAAMPANTGSIVTPGFNGCPGVYFVVQTGTPGTAAHIKAWRNGAWETIV